jgi:hypothetical protein
MAPKPIHEQPHSQVRRLAEAARREGLDFEVFWARAVREGASLVMTNHPAPPEGAVRWPTDRNDRLGWQRAIYDSKDGWRRAYYGEPAPPCERALTMLGEAFALLDVVAAQAAEEAEPDEPEPHGLPARAGLLSAA